MKKVITKPDKSFRAECDRCGCEFTYELDDMYKQFASEVVSCPSCEHAIYHFIPRHPRVHW